MSQLKYEVVNQAFIDLLEIFYWRVFSMGANDECKQDSHVNKHEVLAMIEDAQEALREI